MEQKVIPQQEHKPVQAEIDGAYISTSRAAKKLYRTLSTGQGNILLDLKTFKAEFFGLYLNTSHFMEQALNDRVKTALKNGKTGGDGLMDAWTLIDLFTEYRGALWKSGRLSVTK